MYSVLLIFSETPSLCVGLDMLCDLCSSVVACFGFFVFFFFFFFFCRGPLGQRSLEWSEIRPSKPKLEGQGDKGFFVVSVILP